MGRFKFGKNWSQFLTNLNEQQIDNAKSYLKFFLGKESLSGFTFIDVGCGSGLSSLVARQLGAKVFSFDYDPESVNCTLGLKNRYFSDDESWQIESGSALDETYISSLGSFDIVYSWGVLHHTGDMKKALINVMPLVKEGGLLYISIYNYQPYWSKLYKIMKQAYIRSPKILSALILAIYIASQVVKGFVRDIVMLKNPKIRYKKSIQERGMSKIYDWIDWVGGYPFEVAKPEDIFDIFHQHQFELIKMKTMSGGLGCNEFLFKKKQATQ